jgi:hypothetical protein
MEFHEMLSCKVLARFYESRGVGRALEKKVLRISNGSTVKIDGLKEPLRINLSVRANSGQNNEAQDSKEISTNMSQVRPYDTSRNLAKVERNLDKASRQIVNVVQVESAAQSVVVPVLAYTCRIYQHHPATP